MAGIKALLTVLDPELDATLQEAGVDSICKLAAAPENRQNLVQQVIVMCPPACLPACLPT